MSRRPSPRGASGDAALPSRTLPTPESTEEPGWREWMRDLGRRQRRLREFLGLSQDQLARLAGVSQGAVSRLETGRGVATPLLIVLKTTAALVHELRRLDPVLLDPELREAIRLQAALVPLGGLLGGEPQPLTGDRHLEELIRLYRQTPARHRDGLLQVLRTMVVGLKPKAPSSS